MKDALQDRCNYNIRFLAGRKIAQKKTIGLHSIKLVKHDCAWK
jgi:hypothetical protein